jgi:PPM family protein phosphatase
MRFSIFQDTEIGGRSVNQDRMGYCFTSDSLMMILADGMGGHLRGEVAAQMTLQSVGASFQAQARPRVDDPVSFLDGALRKAHRDILRYQTQNSLPEAPRTTVVAAIIQDSKIWWAHAGDSRLYLVRNAKVILRTRDHSKVQTMVALGLIKPGEEDTHPERNKVLNCLGSPFEPTVEINPPVKLISGDRVLLCSDGLWSGLSDEALSRAITEKPMELAVPEMVKTAIDSNGRMADNTTAVGLHWDGDELRHDGVPAQELADATFTTTIVAHLDEAEPERDITEDEIEKTILEIRNAIEKSNAR